MSNKKDTKIVKSQNSIICEKIAKGINKGVHEIYEKEHEFYDHFYAPQQQDGSNMNSIVDRTSSNSNPYINNYRNPTTLGTSLNEDSSEEEEGEEDQDSFTLERTNENTDKTEDGKERSDAIEIFEEDDNDKDNGEVDEEMHEIMEDNINNLTYDQIQDQDQDQVVPWGKMYRDSKGSTDIPDEGSKICQYKEVTLNGSMQSTAFTLPEMYEVNDDNSQDTDIVNESLVEYNAEYSDSLPDENRSDSIFPSSNTVSLKDPFAKRNESSSETRNGEGEEKTEENENFDHNILTDDNNDKKPITTKIEIENKLLPKEKKEINKRYRPVIYHTDSSVLTGADRFEFLYLDAQIRAYKLEEKRKREEMEWECDYFRPEITEKGRRSSYAEAQVGLYQNGNVKVDCCDKINMSENDQASPRNQNYDVAAFKPNTDTMLSLDQTHQAYLEKLYKDGERIQWRRETLQKQLVDKELTFQPKFYSSKSYKTNCGVTKNGIQSDISYIPNISDSANNENAENEKKKNAKMDIYTRSLHYARMKEEKTNVIMEETMKNCTFKPEINHKKNRRTETCNQNGKYYQNENKFIKKGQTDRFEELYRNHQQIKLKKQEMKLQMEMKASKELTLVPQISKVGANYKQDTNVYRRLSDSLIHFNNKIPEVRRSSIGRDPRLSECTFKPSLYHDNRNNMNYKQSKIEDRSNVFLKCREAKIQQLKNREEQRLRESCTFHPHLQTKDLITGHVKGKVMSDIHKNYHDINKKLATESQNRRIEYEMKNCTFEPCTDTKQHHKAYLKQRRGNQNLFDPNHKNRYNGYDRKTTYTCLAGTEISGYCTENHLTKKVIAKNTEEDDEVIDENQEYEQVETKAYIPRSTIKETLQYSFLNKKDEKKEGLNGQDTCDSSDIRAIHNELKKLVINENNLTTKEDVNLSTNSPHFTANINETSISSNFTNRETPLDLVVEDYILPEKNIRAMKKRQRHYTLV